MCERSYNKTVALITIFSIIILNSSIVSAANVEFVGVYNIIRIVRDWGNGEKYDSNSSTQKYSRLVVTENYISGVFADTQNGVRYYTPLLGDYSISGGNIILNDKTMLQTLTLYPSWSGLNLTITTQVPDPNGAYTLSIYMTKINNILFDLPSNPERYTANDDSTVLDNTTNLLWQKNTPFQSMTWQQAKTYCEQLNLYGYEDWQLPEIDWLRGLRQRNTNAPNISPIFNAMSSFYWSNTIHEYLSSSYKGIDFGSMSPFVDDFDTYKTASNNYYVMCVRTPVAISKPVWDANENHKVDLPDIIYQLQILTGSRERN